MTEISVIVPAWNAAATVGATVEALARQEIDRAYEVIVVDNGSDDETAGVAAAADRTRVVSKEHTGPGEARNRGAAEARGDLLAFTDADCVPAPDWLRNGAAALDGADLVQGAVKPDPGAERRPFDRSVWVDGSVPLYETANLFVRRELFERLGGFEDWLAPLVGDRPLAEDIWFGWRARRAGARVGFCDDALVHHAVFRQGVVEYVRERLRLAYFPAIVARIPELRRELLFGRLFLSRRSAAFDGAVAAALVALVLGSALALAGVAPYAAMLAADASRWRRRAPLAAAGELAADATGCAALIAGSVRAGRPVL